MEVFYAIVGLFTIYANIHFAVLQQKKVWSKRSGWEKFLTIFTFVSVGLIYLGIMFGE